MILVEYICESRPDHDPVTPGVQLLLYIYPLKIGYSWTFESAPELDDLVDRLENLCVVCGEGTLVSLSVGGEGRLSQVLRPND